MKTLLLLRHGKAQADAPNGDKARRLVERGRREAGAMGRRLPQPANKLDLVVSSDAHRAEETAEIAASAAGYTGHIALEPAIYAADLDTLLLIVQALPASSECVLMVGHNPGFEDLAAALASEDAPPPRLPTAGLALLQFDAQSWRDVRPGAGTLKAVWTPREVGTRGGEKGL